MTETNAVDHTAVEALLQAVGGDRGFLTDLLETYFDDSPQQLNSMRAALDAGNTEAFRRAAHSLKSNSSNFGATRLAAICSELEELGKSGTLAGAGERLAAAEREYEQVRDELRSTYIPH